MFDRPVPYGVLEGKRVAGIIGCNFLERYGAVIDYRTMTMTLRPAQSKLARMQGIWVADAQLKDGTRPRGGITVEVRGPNCTVNYPAGGWMLKAKLAESATTVYGESALDLVGRTLSTRDGVASADQLRLIAPFLVIAPGDRLLLMLWSDPGRTLGSAAHPSMPLDNTHVEFRPSAGFLARLLPVTALLKPYAPYADDPVRLGHCTVQYRFDGTLTVDADRPPTRATFRGAGVTLGPLKP